MSIRRLTFGLLAALPLLTAAPAFAAETKPYEAAAFEAAQKEGRPVLVHVTAPWCPTCAAQKPVLSKLEAEPRFAALQVFDIDFDSQKALLKQFKASSQSTLIVYKGGKEAGRSVGETKPAAIKALLDKAV